MGDWAELLPELLTLIAGRINLYEDLVAFGGVCRSWRSVDVKYKFHESRVQIPWLMLAEEEEENNNPRRGFASLTKGGMVHRVDLAEARGKRCLGSMGWLVTTDEQGNMELLHPLSLVQIHLPHISASNFKLYEDVRLGIHRAVLSASPSVTQDYALMIIAGSDCSLAFWKPGNKVWTVIEPKPHFFCLDVIYYKDQFYAIDTNSNLLLCNLDSSTVLVVGQVSIEATAVPYEDAYLVESGGDLLLISRKRDSYEYDTRSFRVFKFDAEDLNKWQEMYDLGGTTSLFVGQSAATAVAVPCACAGIKPNCIYFTDDYEQQYETLDYPAGGKDTGFYNMESRDVEPLVGMLFPQVSLPHNYYCPPLWVSPSF